MVSGEENYIYRRVQTLERVEVPEGSVKCPRCKGRGEIRRIWGGPNMPGQYTTCPLCMGLGYLSKKQYYEWQKENVRKQTEGW